MSDEVNPIVAMAVEISELRGLVNALISAFDATSKAQTEAYTAHAIALDLILRADDSARLRVAEAIRLILMKPIESAPLPQGVRDSLRTLRDGLLKPSPPGVAEAFRQPTLRPVE